MPQIPDEMPIFPAWMCEPQLIDFIAQASYHYKKYWNRFQDKYWEVLEYVRPEPEDVGQLTPNGGCDLCGGVHPFKCF